MSNQEPAIRLVDLALFLQRTAILCWKKRRQVIGWSKHALYPLLFSLFPLFSFVGSNASEVQSGNFSVGIFIVLSLVIAFSAWLISLLITFNPKKASLLSLVFIFVFFSFGRLHDLVGGFRFDAGFILIGPVKLLAALSVLLVAIFWWLVVHKIRISTLDRASKLLTIVGAVMVASTLFSIVPAYINAKGAASENDGTTSKSVGEKPDVYYILLDGYGRQDYLKENFGYDNSSFIDYLKDKGFYVADKSHSNYAHTHFSVPSTLNMKYLNYLTDEMGTDTTDRTPLRLLTRDNEVVDTFKGLGYKYVNIGSFWGWTENSPHSDITIQSDGGSTNSIFGMNLDEFTVVYLQTTALKPLVSSKIQDGLLEKILSAFDKTKKVPEIADPTFTFTHIVSPHPPYLFSKDGPKTGTTELELLNEGFSKRQSFVDQTHYVNKLTIDMIDDILAKSDQPPIIILASDHGPASGLDRKEWAETDPSKFDVESIKERMANLNAFYFPDGNYDNLYPEITPVNDFRVIFNQYLGQDRELLEDKVYFSNNKANEYRLIDITNLVD